MALPRDVGCLNIGALERAESCTWCVSFFCAENTIMISDQPRRTSHTPTAMPMNQGSSQDHPDHSTTANNKATMESTMTQFRFARWIRIAAVIRNSPTTVKNEANCHIHGSAPAEGRVTINSATGIEAIAGTSSRRMPLPVARTTWSVWAVSPQPVKFPKQRFLAWVFFAAQSPASSRCFFWFVSGPLV